jgi:phage tail sheath protein FI
LVDADYLGDAGMKAIRFVKDNVMNVFMPDITSASGISSVYDYCEEKRMFYQPDVPSGLDEDGVVTFISGGGLAGYSELGGWVYPWTKIANPNKDIYGQGETIELPSSGIVVAGFLTQDNKVGGVHEAPCGTDNGRMIDVVGLEGETGEALHAVEDVNVRGYLMDNRINVIHRSHEGLFYLDNTDVAKGDGSFPSIGESRGALYIERAVDRALEWVPNRNITAKLYREIYDMIYIFLLGEMRNDAFYNQVPEEAFYINMSAAMNPASARYAGKIYIKIGLAKAGPCKWVYVEVTKDVRALAQEILASQS